MELSEPPESGPALPEQPESMRRPRRRALVNLNDMRPVWGLPAWARGAIATAFPAEWEVVFVSSQVDGRGDGSGVSDEALAAAPGTEIYFGMGAPREIFLAATTGAGARLRWMHTATAGVSSLLYPELVESDVILTNSAGVHAPPMAETVIAMMLYFARGLDLAVAAQDEQRWDSDTFANRVGAVTEVAGSTVGIVGLGGIGSEVARRALGLGMNVVAMRRSGRPGPAGIELATGPRALERVLTAADYLVIAVPSTPATRDLIGAREIASMKAGSVIINVARGDALDETALAEALESGRLRGAALDVFREEPLPAGSPLWQMPNALITPHVSATSPRFWIREVELIRENVARYLAGRGLLNVVDKQRGY